VGVSLAPAVSARLPSRESSVASYVAAVSRVGLASVVWRVLWSAFLAAWRLLSQQGALKTGRRTLQLSL
jgi:hypothetical protein